MRPLALLLAFGLALFSPASAQPTNSLIAPGIDPQTVVGPLKHVDNTLEAVLDQLEKFTGKIILRPQNLQPQKINVSSSVPLTLEQSVNALESILSMNGLALIPVDDTFIRAVQSSIPVNPLSPEIITSEDLNLPPNQKVVSIIRPFDYLTVDQVIEFLPSLLTPGVPAPVPFRKSNSILITDALSNLQRLQHILDDLDRPREFSGAILFIPLRHINSLDLRTQLQQLTEGSLKDHLAGSTTFAADERTNQLIIFTHASNEAVFRRVIAGFDIDVAPLTRSEVFYIKHAEATEVATLLEDIISGQRSVRQQQGGRKTRATGADSAQTQAQPQPAAPQPAATQASAGESGAPNVQFSDYVGIVADTRSNSIAAYGTDSDIAYISELIGKIDILLSQVRIEVIIAEVTLGDEINRGIEAFSVDYNIAGTDGFPGLDEIGLGVDGRAFDITGTLENFSLQSVFQTARSNSDVQILSAPTIVTTHNQEAIINVSESRPVITSVQSDTTNVGSTRSNVQFRDIGIQLTVKPLIGSNGVVQMEIKQTVENVVSTTVIDGNEQPIIGKREATSFISVSDREVVILGGLQEKSLSDTFGRVAFFGDIPLLGELFRSRRKEDRIRELMIFIKPFVIHGTAEARAQAAQFLQQSVNQESVDDYLEKGIDIQDRPRGDPGPTRDFYRAITNPGDAAAPTGSSSRAHP